MRNKALLANPTRRLVGRMHSENSARFCQRQPYYSLYPHTMAGVQVASVKLTERGGFNKHLPAAISPAMMQCGEG
jgi:hypothetical protein